MLNALKIILGPFLLWQGRRVRAETDRLPEPPGERTGQIGSGPRLRLLLLGDSSAAGVGVSALEDSLLGQMLPILAKDYTVEYRLEATSGHKTQDAIDALEALPNEHYDVVLTVLGVNDVSGQTSPNKWEQLQRHLMTQILHRKAQLILVSGLPPMGQFPALPHPLRFYLGQYAKALDQRLIQMAKDTPQIIHLPIEGGDENTEMATDGYHPSAEIYALWARGLVDVIHAEYPKTGQQL